MNHFSPCHGENWGEISEFLPHEGHNKYTDILFGGTRDIYAKHAVIIRSIIYISSVKFSIYIPIENFRGKYPALGGITGIT